MPSQQERGCVQERGGDGSLRVPSAGRSTGMAAGARGVRAGWLRTDASRSSRRPQAGGNTQDARGNAHRRTRLGRARGAPGAAGRPRRRWPCAASAGQREPRVPGRRARGPASSQHRPPARSSRHSSHCVSPAPRLPGTKRRKGAGPRLSPPPARPPIGRCRCPSRTYF